MLSIYKSSSPSNISKTVIPRNCVENVYGLGISWNFAEAIYIPFFISYAHRNSSAPIRRDMSQNDFVPVDRTNFLSFCRRICSVASPKEITPQLLSVDSEEMLTIDCANNVELLVTIVRTLCQHFAYAWSMRSCVLGENSARIRLATSQAETELSALIVDAASVFPKDIQDCGAVYLKILDSSYEYYDMVFSNNKNMFDIDGDKGPEAYTTSSTKMDATLIKSVKEFVAYYEGNRKTHLKIQATKNLEKQNPNA